MLAEAVLANLSNSEHAACPLGMAVNPAVNPAPPLPLPMNDMEDMNTMTPAIFIGTAGWSLPRAEQERFAAEGTHLARYAQALTGVDVNSSVYRAHAASVYAKWASSVPPDFRFSVKMPKTITHEKRLFECEELLCAFLDQVQGLGDRLGCVLIQLPPSLEFDESLTAAFFEMFRAIYDDALALEPRNPSWFTRDAARLLVDYDIARVAADPARVPDAAVPGGASDLAYFRLHGSPRIYWSRYDESFLEDLTLHIRNQAQRTKAVWCIFDNTASGSAMPNALDVLGKVAASASR
jgi:uncharacterized protein YecE (DUF72 family)